MAYAANILANGGASFASYVALTGCDSSVNLLLLIKDNSGFNTWFIVQGIGDADANGTVSYSDGTSNSALILPNAAAIFDQSLQAHADAVFSANVTSVQSIVPLSC